jgi:integrase
MVGGRGLEPLTSAMSTGTARLNLLNYLNELRTRGLSNTYINKVEELISTYLENTNEVSSESAKGFIGRYNHRKPNTRARYATYLRGFLNYLGIPFTLKVKVPKQLPPFVSSQDIEKLMDYIRNRKTHRYCCFRDLVLIETACKTGLRRTELANLRIKDIDFVNKRLKVIGGKGSKDRVVPLANGLVCKLSSLCDERNPEDSVFGLSSRSLGMKIYYWAKKAGVEIHTHSFRHYFGTTLADKGAHIRAIQDLWGIIT